ncbi:unnamed protein product [Allacma fusca]|uniref:Amidase domain-containing protein n=1 Tax=Allacma fusca TaxID=39272 RepID=A0A8J2JT43_9HEXA|nr:unnamed protein product [Allacma fusca]
MRSTAGRLSGRGITGIVEDTPGITCVPGIIASRAKTLSFVYKIITTDDTQYKYDATTVPIPWSSQMYESKQTLRIGYFTSSPVFPAVEVERTGVLMKCLNEQKKLREQVLDDMKRLNITLLLAPVYPTPACKIKDADDIIGNLFYAFEWNVLNLPAGVVPFGTESGTKVEAYNDEGDMFLKLAKQGTESAKGMPIGVQIIGQPFQEEVVLRILTELEDFKNTSS